MILRLKRSITLSNLARWATLFALILFVLLPTFYLISYVFTRWNEVNYEVFTNPIIGDENWRQIQQVLFFSFRLSLSTVAFDLIFGIPLAYILARKKFRGKSLLEDLITLPLVIPTSGFGFATLITWTTSTGLGGIFGLNSGLIPLDAVIPLLNIPFLVFIAISYTHLTLPTILLV